MPLREGSKVIGGTVLARVGGSQDGVAPHINFSIRPAGRGAPRIDPKPILDGWKLLEATAIYRAAGKNPFFNNLGVGATLLMSKEALIPRVLADPRLEIYSCGRTDIATGQVDRRVLAALEYLVEKGFRLTLTSLKCGHGFFTASGNVSNHSSGNAIDIAEINGIPVLGHQGPGTLTHALLETVMQLQGTMAPEELISLEELGGPSFAMADHADHVHIGWQPMYGNGKLARQFNSLLKPKQWQRLIERWATSTTRPSRPRPRSTRDSTTTLAITGPPGPTRATRLGADSGVEQRARRARLRGVRLVELVMAEAQLFPFAQLEFAGQIGLSDGRYLARAGGRRDAAGPRDAAGDGGSARRCWWCRRSAPRARPSGAGARAWPRPARPPSCR